MVSHFFFCFLVSGRFFWIWLGMKSYLCRISENWPKSFPLSLLGVNAHLPSLCRREAIKEFSGRSEVYLHHKQHNTISYIDTHCAHRILHMHVLIFGDRRFYCICLHIFLCLLSVPHTSNILYISTHRVSLFTFLLRAWWKHQPDVNRRLVESLSLVNVLVDVDQ